MRDAAPLFRAMRRRACVRLATLGLAASVWGCGEPTLKFNTTDITGATMGPTLGLLRDGEGRPRPLESFRGQVVAVFFGFVNCPDVCPTTLSHLKAVKQALGPDGERLAVIFVTIDPERDEAKLILEYAAAFDPAFVALRGSADDTAAVAREFKIVYEKVGDPASTTYSMNHSAGIFLFDPTGRPRLYARHEDDFERIVPDVRLLLAGR